VGGTNFLLLNARFAGGRDDMSEKSGGSVGGGSVGGGSVGGGGGSVGFGGTSNSEVGKVAEKSLKDEEPGPQPRDPNGDRDEVDEKYKEPAGTEHSDQYLTKFPNETPG